MLGTLIFFAVCFLAYSNGANDNFKGVARLVLERRRHPSRPLGCRRVADLPDRRRWKFVWPGKWTLLQRGPAGLFVCLAEAASACSSSRSRSCSMIPSSFRPVALS